MLEETLVGGLAGKKDKVAPVVEDETARLKRLRDKQLADRTASNRPQAGGGARDGLSIPEMEASADVPVLNQLAQKSKVPAKVIPKGTPL